MEIQPFNTYGWHRCGDFPSRLTAICLPPIRFIMRPSTGFCAYGVSIGRKAPIGPNVWKIVNGKLYLNYDAGVGEELRMEMPGRIAKADKNWVRFPKE